MRFKKLILFINLALVLGLFFISNHAAQTATDDQTNLRINEFMADNESTLIDPAEEEEYPDWIELYNPSDADVSLGGLFMSDDAQDLTQFELSTELTVPAGSFLLLYADSDPEQGPDHLGFKLGAGGGDIILYRASDNLLIDSYQYDEQQPDISMGLNSDGQADTWQFFSTATPGTTNQSAPPALSDLFHTPNVPGADQAVEVSVAVVANSPIRSAQVYYKDVASTGDFTAIDMTLAGGNRYTSQIPEHPNGTEIAYYISVTDEAGLSSLMPQQAPTEFARYLVGYQLPNLVINEFIANNNGQLTLTINVTETITPDWIELYNPSDQTISLDGLFLTDNLAEPTKYPIPDGLSISPKGYQLFYASDLEEQGAEHTNFKLSSGGESVGLYGAFGNVEIDSISYLDIGSSAYGRFASDDDPWQLLVCPSPGNANILCDNSTYLSLIMSQSSE